jgi:hypothetical protein
MRCAGRSGTLTPRPECSGKGHVLSDLAVLHCNATCRPLVHEKNKRAQSSTNRDESKPNYFLDFISLLPFQCDINCIINAHSQPNNREKFHRNLLKHFVVVRVSGGGSLRYVTPRSGMMSSSMCTQLPPEFYRVAQTYRNQKSIIPVTSSIQSWK